MRIYTSLSLFISFLSVWEGAYVSSLYGALFRMLQYMQHLDMRCGIGKNCWLDDYLYEEAGVMCALLVLYIIVFEVRNICCRMIWLYVYCWFYILQFLK